MKRAACVFLVSMLALAACTCPGPDTPDAAVGEDAGQDLDAGSGCVTDGDCDGGVCQPTTGLCLARSCLTDRCDAGQFCDLGTLQCASSTPSAHPTYVGETLAGHSEQRRLGLRDARGLSAMGDFFVLVAARDGRSIYAVDEDNGVLIRFDQASRRVETVAGLGWPGEVDGPADVAQLQTDFYQAGGIVLTPDEQALYVTGVHGLRRIELPAGDVSTVSIPGLTSSMRGLAVGASGDLYVTAWGSQFYVLHPDGGVETRAVVRPRFPDGGTLPPAGYIVVDEARGWIYGLERNHRSGSFTRWPVDGGDVEWLNWNATGRRDPVQYLSDGPVANLDMANPAGLTMDDQGMVFIGSGDGRTFRRYDPSTQLVESLCTTDAGAGGALRFEWCIGDNVRNRPFGTWPSRLAFDSAGNGYFGYSVWPRLVRLRREP